MEIERILDKIGDYEITIEGIKAFQRAIVWRNKVDVPHKCSFGRRMSPSKTNRFNTDDYLTPDIVLQLRKDVGYVVEVKKSFPMDHEFWRKAINQIIKYDDDLTGWWTENEKIPMTNVVGLIWTKFIKDFVRQFEEIRIEEEIESINPTSIIEFSRVGDVKTVILIRREWGEIHDDISNRLTSGITVPVEVIHGARSKPLKFVDARPEIEYTMVILWNDIFNKMSIDVEYDEEKKARLLQVNVHALTEELQRLYGSIGEEERERKFPRDAWIRDALKAFCTLGYAEQVDNDDNYIIKFKTTLRTGESGDLIERFARHREMQEDYAEEDGHQLELF